MNTNSTVRTLTLVLAAALFAAACNNKKEKENSNAEENKTAGDVSAPAPSASAAPAEKAVVNFAVNDTAAVTIKGAANDAEPQLGLYTEASKQLSFGLLGDVPGRPHRGWLNFSIQDFKFEPATYSLSAGSNASFTRYETANAGGASDYIADNNPVNKGTEMTINFTRIEKDPSQARTYLVSGTFSASLYNKIYSMKRDSKETVTITNGSFENVPVVGGPAH